MCHLFLYLFLIWCLLFFSHFLSDNDSGCKINIFYTFESYCFLNIFIYLQHIHTSPIFTCYCKFLGHLYFNFKIYILLPNPLHHPSSPQYLLKLFWFCSKTKDDVHEKVDCCGIYDSVGEFINWEIVTLLASLILELILLWYLFVYFGIIATVISMGGYSWHPILEIGIELGWLIYLNQRGVETSCYAIMLWIAHIVVILAIEWGQRL